MRAAAVGCAALFVLLAGGATAAQALCGATVTALAALCERWVCRRDGTMTGRLQRRAAVFEDERTVRARLLALELDHDRSQSVLEALGEGVVVVEASGEVVMANHAARAAMDAAGGPVEGRLLWDLLPLELGRRARDAWVSLGDNPHATASVMPVRFLSVPCRQRIFDLTAVQVRSLRTGQDFGYVFLLVDCTRSHELQQLKDRFLSSVSHELRTPLTNICAFAEILGTMLPGESMEWPEFVRVIHDESVQLSRLVDAMFDYLQLEAGEAVLRNQVVDGAAIAREVVAAQIAAAGERGVRLRGPNDVEAALRVDPMRLRQLCAHLVDNALKFTPDGGDVSVQVRVVDEVWELQVADSGPGVPVEDRRAVFEKFHQLPDLLTDKPSGTGLGLATCEAIVRCYGGTIVCCDSPSGGACFVVRLPAPARSPASALPIAALAESALALGSAESNGPGRVG